MKCENNNNLMKSIIITNKRYINKESVIRILLATLFGISFVYKIISHADFADYLAAILKINESCGAVVSNIILGVELYITLRLLQKNKPIVAIRQALSMLILFSFILVYLIITNYSGGCFCYGYLISMSPLQSLAKNIAIVAICAFVLRRELFKLFKMGSLSDIAKIVVSVVSFALIFTKPVNIAQENIQQIDVERFNVLNRENKVIVIDARLEWLFIKDHIPNAINYPYKYEKYTKINIPAIEQNPKITVVVYCDSKLCSLGSSLAAALKKRYTNINVLHLKGGYDAWRQNNN